MNNLLITILIVLVIAGCSDQNTEEIKYLPGGPYYYKSWATYFKPYRPVDKITLSEAKELEKNGYAYYVAYFDNKGRIKSFDKFHSGKTVWKSEYSYENSKIKETMHSDGNKVVNTLDN